MRKQTLGLLACLLLCLGLLPLTARAAGGDLTVCGQDVIDGTDSSKPTYWLNDGSGSITQTGANADSYNVMYDGNGALILNNADLTYASGHVIHSQLENLEIQLTGNNEISAAGSFSSILPKQRTAAAAALPSPERGC